MCQEPLNRRVLLPLRFIENIVTSHCCCCYLAVNQPFLLPTWRRFVLTHWSQSHPLFRLNGKNRLPVSWTPPSHACTHTHSLLHAPTQVCTPLFATLFPSLTNVTLTPSLTNLMSSSHSPPSSFPLSHSSFPSLSLLHPSLSAFCSNCGVTSCRKSHGSCLEKNDPKQSQDGSERASPFFDYHYTTRWLGWFYLIALKAYTSVSFHFSFSPCSVLSQP